jgi:hypothetical protein
MDHLPTLVKNKALHVFAVMWQKTLLQMHIERKPDPREKKKDKVDLRREVQLEAIKFLYEVRSMTRAYNVLRQDGKQSNSCMKSGR